MYATGSVFDSKIGEQTLKNIDRPVRAHSISQDFPPPLGTIGSDADARAFDVLSVSETVALHSLVLSMGPYFKWTGSVMQASAR
jgi:hypothetical protein